MVKGEMVARTAERLTGLDIPYRLGGESLKGLDCQGLVEYCLRALGENVSWKGSNAMWRDLKWRGTPEECREKFGCVPEGALLFIVKRDGGEKDRGYNDGDGNAQHVGIVTRDGAVHASSSRGRVCPSEFHGKTIRGGWNQVGFLKMVDYALPGTEGGEEERREEGLQGKVFADNGQPVRLRKSPSDKGETLTKLKVGSEVEVLEDLGDWMEIRSGRLRGFMMARFIQVREEAEEEDAWVPENLEDRVRALERFREEVEEWMRG